MWQWSAIPSLLWSTWSLALSIANDAILLGNL